jgi:hypothetical protein
MLVEGRTRDVVEGFCCVKKKKTYLADAAGPVPLVLDLRIAHERWGSTSNPILNGYLHYPRPADIDSPLNETVVGKIGD